MTKNRHRQELIVKVGRAGRIFKCELTGCLQCHLVRSLIFHGGSFIGSTQFAPRKETLVNAATERECSQITLVYAANERECSQSSCNADCGDEAIVKAAENCSGMATLRAWKW